MRQHSFRQHSPQWYEHRAKCFNASDAPAMMGVDPNRTRTQLLQELHSGIGREVSDFVQERVLDPGSQFEALARPLAAEVIGEPIYPVVADDDGASGLSRPLSASFDGITVLDDPLWEHKRANSTLRAIMARGDCAGADLPIYHRVQMEQQLLVSGAERALFTASNWTPEGEPVEVYHCWYAADLALREKIIAGWRQFDADLAAYVPPPVAEPAKIGRAMDSLPALRIELSGHVQTSNLATFRTVAMTALREINRDLQTDQDFADAEKAVKWCGEVESRITAAKEHALSQTASIDELLRTLDGISAEARKVRLELDKLVKQRKEAIRGEICDKARTALVEHVNRLNERIGGNWVKMPAPTIFGEAIKGLRTVASVQNACDTALANAKIETSATADRFEANRKALQGEAHDWMFLFPDFHIVGGEGAEYFAAILAQRIQKHNDAIEQARKLAERAQPNAQESGSSPAAPPAPYASNPVAATAGPSGAVAGAAVAALPAAAPASTNEPATLNAGAIAKRLGFTLTVDFITNDLGIPAKTVEKGRIAMWTESQFVAICGKLIQHVSRVSAGQQQEQRAAA